MFELEGFCGRKKVSFRTSLSKRDLKYDRKPEGLNFLKINIGIFLINDIVKIASIINRSCPFNEYRFQIKIHIELVVDAVDGFCSNTLLDFNGFLFDAQ
jgi:hypothetical protein